MRAIVALVLFVAANVAVMAVLRPPSPPAAVGPRSFASPAKFQDRVPQAPSPLTFEERWAPVKQIVARSDTFEQRWEPVRRLLLRQRFGEAMVVPQLADDAPTAFPEPVRAIPVTTVRVAAAAAAVVPVRVAQADTQTGRPEKAACRRVGMRTVWRGRWSWNCRR